MFLRWIFVAAKNRKEKTGTATAAPRYASTQTHGGAYAGQNKKLEDLFHETLKDIYYAEKKILVALPKMAKAVNSEELRAAFEKHVGETQGQVERIQQVFKLLKQPAKGKTCPAILGLVEEGEEVMEDFEDSEALDAGLLSGAQAL